MRLEAGCLKGKIVPIPITPSTSTNWTTTKGRAKEKAKVQGLLHRRGMESATHGGKESAQQGISANTNMLNQQTPKHPLLRLTPSNRPKHRPSTKQQFQQLSERFTSQCPPSLSREPRSEAKKDDKGAEESEAVYHDRDAEDAMSESSRWSGETDIPEKYVWFQEILGNDVSEEVECLKNEDEQWRTNSMWYKGFFDDVPQSSSNPVNAKTFKTSDHRRHLAYSHQKAIISAEIMSKVVNDIYRTHKMPMNKERTFQV